MVVPNHAVTPVLLLPNTVYYISESTNTSVNNVSYGGALAVNPAIVYLGHVFSGSNHALPTTGVSGYANGFFRANFEFSHTAVPEPSSLAFLSVCAFGGLAVVRLKRLAACRPCRREQCT